MRRLRTEGSVAPGGAVVAPSPGRSRRGFGDGSRSASLSCKKMVTAKGPSAAAVEEFLGFGSGRRWEEEEEEGRRTRRILAATAEEEGAGNTNTNRDGGGMSARRLCSTACDSDPGLVLEPGVGVFGPTFARRG